MPYKERKKDRMLTKLRLIKLEEKKQKQKGKIDKLLKKCQDYKDEAAAKVKLG